MNRRARGKLLVIVENITGTWFCRHNIRALVENKPFKTETAKFFQDRDQLSSKPEKKYFAIKDTART